MEDIDKQLPETVEKFKCAASGCTIYIVGTAHVSEKSAEDAKKTIELVRPHTVVIELCGGRKHLLSSDDELREMMKSQPKSLTELLQVYIENRKKKAAREKRIQKEEEEERERERERERAEQTREEQPNQESPAPTTPSDCATTTDHQTTQTVVENSSREESTQQNPNPQQQEDPQQEYEITQKSADENSDQNQNSAKSDVGNREFAKNKKKKKSSSSDGYGDILPMLMSYFTSKIGSVLSVLPGAEFRAAFRATNDLGARLVLGDRPVQITLRRCWSSLTKWQKVKLCVRLCIESMFSFKEEDIAKLLANEDDIFTSMANAMRSEFPLFAKTLIDERDLYLAYTMWKFANYSNPERMTARLPAPLPAAAPGGAPETNLGEIRNGDFDLASMGLRNRKNKNAEERNLGDLGIENEKSQDESEVFENLQEDGFQNAVVAVVGMGHMDGIRHHLFDLDKTKRNRGEFKSWDKKIQKLLNPVFEHPTPTKGNGFFTWKNAFFAFLSLVLIARILYHIFWRLRE